MRTVDSLAGSLALVLLGVAIAIYAREFDLGTFAQPGAGFMPALAGLVIAGSAAVGIFEAIRGHGHAPQGEALWNLPTLWQHALVLAIVSAFGALLETVGFVLCAVVLIVVAARVLGREPWRDSLVWAVVLTAASYVLFAVLLKVELPRGLLP